MSRNPQSSNGQSNNQSEPVVTIIPAPDNSFDPAKPVPFQMDLRITRDELSNMLQVEHRKLLNHMRAEQEAALAELQKARDGEAKALCEAATDFMKNEVANDGSIQTLVDAIGAFTGKRHTARTVGTNYDRYGGIDNLEADVDNVAKTASVQLIIVPAAEKNAEPVMEKTITTKLPANLQADIKELSRSDDEIRKASERLTGIKRTSKWA